MSWPPDAPTPDADSTPESTGPETNEPETEASVNENPVVETEAAAKPARRRRPPRARTAAPAAEAGPEAEPPVAEAEAASEPVRRRGRRKAVPEASPATGETAPEESVAPTRRRGQRRAIEAVPPAADLPGLVEGIPSQEEPPAPAPEPVPPPARRRGRRRATQPEAVSEEPAEAAEGDPNPTDETVPEAAADEEADGKKRRRRGRRRRGQDEVPLESVEMTQTGAPVPEVMEAEEEETIFYLPPPVAAVYSAPPLVPAAQPPADGALLPRTNAFVRRSDGLARIVVGEAAHAPYVFFINTETAERGEVVDSQIREAAAAGIHLYSGVLYLPLRNAYGDRSFGAADALLQQVLAADPDAFLLPRLQFFPTNYWARTHTDQAAHYADGSDGDISLASTEFWADCVDALEALIAHFADPGTPGGDRIIGFHLDRGEWFHGPDSGPDLSQPNGEAFRRWLQAKYQAPYALRAAWYDGSVTFDDAEIPSPPPPDTKNDGKRGIIPLYAGARDGRWVDYAFFTSETFAQVIVGLAAAVKTLSAGHLLVAVSYGYTLEFSHRNDAGHFALGLVLASPDIDIVAGPNSYAARGASGTGAFGSPIDSVALHGKLWLVEDDTKTFLAEAETPDTYNPRIVGGADTQTAHQRHFGAALAHGAGVTWMDLWGQGWLDSPDVWRELGRLRDLSRLREQITPAVTPPEVAVLVDEASLAYLKSDPEGLGLNLVAKTRDLLLRAGSSVGFYLQSDVTQENFPEAKLYLFVNALRVTTAERQAIREHLQRPGKTLVWLYAPGMFDEKGPATQESSEVVGMALRLQPWNARGGSEITDARHPITERLRGSRKLGQDETLNPSYAVSDPQATVLAEYAVGGGASLAAREHAGGWKAVFLGDPHLSVELLRGLYAYAGVHIYDGQDDIVYAGDGALLIQATFTGQRTISLPRNATIYDALENTIVATDVRTFRVFLRANTTRLFLWGERAAVLAATGLPLPAAAPMSNTPEPPPLPPPPDFKVPISPPLSEPAFEIAARYERTQTETSDMQDMTLEVSDLAAVLEMEDGDAQVANGEAEGNAGEEASRPRSRWQRRRAAARARRDAERLAQAGAAPESGAAAAPPLDIATILPDLPPRRKAPDAEPAADDPDEDL